MLILLQFIIQYSRVFRVSALFMRDLTSDWWNDLVKQFHTGAFPDLLNNCTQLFVCLLKIT